MTSVMNMNQREFIDKKLVFSRIQATGKNDKDNSDDIFLWVTSTPNDLYPMSTKHVRSDSIIGIVRIGRIAAWPHAFEYLKSKKVEEIRGCYFHYIS